MIYFAGWKEHYSIYPSNDRLVAAFKDELAPYEVNGKGTIRFPLSEPIPVKLICGHCTVPGEGIGGAWQGGAGHAEETLTRGHARLQLFEPVEDDGHLAVARVGWNRSGPVG